MPCSDAIWNQYKNAYEFYKKEHTDFEVHFGTLLTGDELINSLKYRNELVKRAENNGCKDIIGGEMEALGVFEAAENFKTDCIIIKGVSDYVDGKKIVSTNHKLQ